MSTPHLRRTISTLAATALVLAAAACGSGAAPAAPELPGSESAPWSGVEERGLDQGSARIYTTLVPAVYESAAKAFNAQYPKISLEFTRGTSTELAARLDAEIAGGTDGADLVLDANPPWSTANADKLVKLSAVPAAKAWPKDAWHVDGAAPKVTYSPQAMITWNKNVFPNGFKNWSDVLDPSVSGKLGVYENPNLNTATYYAWLQRTNGDDYVPGLARLAPKFYPSVVPMTQAIASGEIGVSLFNVTAVIKPLQESGAPIDYVIPDDTQASFFTGSVLKNAKRPDAAILFMNFLMTPQGQEALNGNGFASSPLPDVPGTLTPTKMFVLGDDPVTTPADVEAWNTRFREIFNR